MILFEIKIFSNISFDEFKSNRSEGKILISRESNHYFYALFQLNGKSIIVVILRAQNFAKLLV